MCLKIIPQVECKVSLPSRGAIVFLFLFYNLYIHILLFQEDADLLITYAKEVNESLSGSGKLENIDEKLLKQLSYIAKGDVCPMQGVIGGIVAQEVMKVCECV